MRSRRESTTWIRKKTKKNLDIQLRHFAVSSTSPFVQLNSGQMKMKFLTASCKIRNENEIDYYLAAATCVVISHACDDDLWKQASPMMKTIKAVKEKETCTIVKRAAACEKLIASNNSLETSFSSPPWPEPRHSLSGPINCIFPCTYKTGGLRWPIGWLQLYFFLAYDTAMQLWRKSEFII